VRGVNSASPENNLQYSGILHKVIKSRKMRWVGHVARTEDRRGAFRVLVRGGGGLEEKRPLGRPRLDGREILKNDL